MASRIRGGDRTRPATELSCYSQINTVMFVLSAKVSCHRKHHYYERKGVV